MIDINYGSLSNGIKKTLMPFLQDTMPMFGDNLHSVHLYGSALTSDYIAGTSDLNTILVLKEMDLRFVEMLAPKGRKYAKNKIAAPLLMTPGYIAESLDVFPVEFVNIKLRHKTLYGEDVFASLDINKSDLRRQAEFELKSRLLGLRQMYIHSTADKKLLMQGIVISVKGLIPVLRAVLVLFGKMQPDANKAVMDELRNATGIDMGPLSDAIGLKNKKSHTDINRLNLIFEGCYMVMDRLGKAVDGIQA